jgi:hypothetical protein
MAKGRNKINATGRNKTSRFARFDHSLLESPAYRALTPNARSLLIELTRMDNNYNNGALWLSVRDAAALMGVANTKTASAAFNELKEMGFIVMTKDAHFQVKAADTARARCWRLTWEAVPKKHGPTNDYKQRQPSTKLAIKRMDRGLRAIKTYKCAISKNQMPVVDLNTLTPFPSEATAIAVGELPTVKPINDAFLPKLSVGNLRTHTADHGGEENKAAISLAWWQPKGLNPLIAGMLALDAVATISRQRECERLAE